PPPPRPGWVRCCRRLPIGRKLGLICSEVNLRRAEAPGNCQRLLVLAALTNAELAGLSGFFDEPCFSNTFSRLGGSSPREFRKEFRQSTIRT
ncbi:MAG: hypothetical protein ACO3J2_06765, partial [Chthoniobacterales bacterium]